MSSRPRSKLVPLELIAVAAIFAAALASPAAAQASRDLSVTQTESPDPVRSGDDVTYTVTVTNEGTEPLAAGTELMTSRDPDDPDASRYRLVTPSRGSCESDWGLADCELGMLAAGASANVVAVVRAEESIEHRVTLLPCDEEYGCFPTNEGYSDDDASDNSSVLATRVISPPIQRGSDQIRITGGFPSLCAEDDFRIKVKVLKDISVKKLALRLDREQLAVKSRVPVTNNDKLAVTVPARKLDPGPHMLEAKVTPLDRYVEDFSRRAIFERC